MTTMTDTIEQILQREDELVHAKRALDIEALDGLYSDDLLMSGVMGEPTCSKAAIIDEMKRGIAERRDAIASGRPIEMSAENGSRGFPPASGNLLQCLRSRALHAEKNGYPDHSFPATRCRFDSSLVGQNADN